jgi:hypothetical protein
LLRGEGARMSFDEALGEFPAQAINERGPNFPFSPWQLLEHIRLTQWDIVDYIRNRAYVEQPWPDAYWPPRDQPATMEQFNESIAGFRADNEALQELVLDPVTDLFAVIPDTPGHTILREVRIVGDHNSYHVGEFGVLRHVMGTWPANRRE